MNDDYRAARIFLANILPWPVDARDSFFINVHRRTPIKDRETGALRRDGKGKVQQAYGGKACTSPGQAANHIRWAMATKFDDDYEATGTDIYVCMSGQREANSTTDAKGRVSHRAIRNDGNACAFKGLWVDVDVKPGDPEHGYETSEQALTEFVRIYQAIGLPKPSAFVLSGSGGFHAHWTFDRNITHEEWHPLAHALVAALKEHGFKGDTGCTIDAVRLLRVPDTFNYKAARVGAGPPSPVRFLQCSLAVNTFDSIKAKLSHWISAVPMRYAAPSLPTMLGTPSKVLQQSAAPHGDLSEGLREAVLHPVKAVADVCPFVMRCLQTGGAGNSNPLWLATTRLAMFTSEGKQAAHMLARGHTEYSAEETDALFDRVEQERVARNLGYPTCSNFNAQGATECAGCPHFVKGKSPLSFVVAQPPQPVAVISPPTMPTLATTTPLPNGYTYDPVGRVYVTKTDENGATFREFLSDAYPMLEPWINDHPAEFHFTTVVRGALGTPQEERRPIKFALPLLYEKQAFAKALAEQHVTLSPRQVDPMVNFLMAWINSLREHADKFVQSAPFGWLNNPDGTIKGFVYDKTIFTPMGQSNASNPDKHLDGMYSPTGALEPWKLAAKMITDQKRPEMDCMLAAAFAGPLVRFTGQTGLMLSTYSRESGVGKSTVTKVASSVWGNPVTTVQSLDDTANSVVKKLGQLRNLPAFWDELKTVEDTQRFVQIVFRLSQGKDKSRLKASTEFQEVNQWETLLCSTSNDSLYPAIVKMTKSTTAGVSRIFEFVVPPGKKGQISPADAQQITGALSFNYGHAGRVYAEWLGTNCVSVQKLVAAYLSKYEVELKAASEDRFWLALVAVIMAGATFANHIGLTQFDLPALKAHMCQEFTRQVTMRRGSDTDLSNAETVIDHLSRYLNEMRVRNTLITDIIWRQRGRPPAGSTPVKVIVIPPSNMGEVLVHAAVNTGELRLMKAPFVAWCEKNNLSAHAMYAAMERLFSASAARARLGGCTPYTTQMETVIELNYTHPAFNGEIEY